MDKGLAYSEKAVKHFRNPRNRGEIKGPDGRARQGNPICGDAMEIYIQVRLGRLSDVRFKTPGCEAAIACGSVITEMAAGKTLKEALAISAKDIVEALGGLPEQKLHCSVLAEQTLKSAIADYQKKQIQQ